MKLFLHCLNPFSHDNATVKLFLRNEGGTLCPKVGIISKESYALLLCFLFCLDFALVRARLGVCFFSLYFFFNTIWL